MHDIEYIRLNNVMTLALPFTSALLHQAIKPLHSISMFLTPCVLRKFVNHVILSSLLRKRSCWRAPSVRPWPVHETIQVTKFEMYSAHRFSWMSHRLCIPFKCDLAALQIQLKWCKMRLLLASTAPASFSKSMVNDIKSRLSLNHYIHDNYFIFYKDIFWMQSNCESENKITNDVII